MSAKGRASPRGHKGEKLRRFNSGAGRPVLREFLKSLPDPAPVLELIDAFRRSKTMFTAVTLGVFEALDEGAADAPRLAARLGAQVSAVERLLDACVGMGLVRKQDGVYANTPVAEVYLCDRSPFSMTGYVRYSDEALYPMWAHLDDAVREGTHR